MNFKKFFKNKKVIITGHTGFKGSWMTAYLHSLGAHVYGYSLDSEYENNLFKLLNLSEKIKLNKISDIRDKNEFKTFFNYVRPDFVFHLAAQPLVIDSYKDPQETFEINFNGTLNVLEEIKLLEKNCTAVIVTTDKVYKNQNWSYPYRENDELGGLDPYSASKSTAELLVDSYINSFFSKKNQLRKKVSTARGGNIIGGADWSRNRLFPDFVKEIFSGKQLILRNPHAVRPWQHVFDLINGYLKLAIYMNKSEKEIKSMNFGPSNSKYYNVEDIIKICVSHLGRGSYITNNHQNAEFKETHFLALDSTKANTLLNWHNKLGTIDAVKNTLEWYKVFHESPDNIVDFSYNQLNNFFNE